MKKPIPQGRDRKRGTLGWFAFALFSVFVCVSLIGTIVVFAFYVQIDQSLPSVEALRNYHPPLVTGVYSQDGLLLAEFFVQRRYLVSLNELPPNVVKAFIAAEDARFYEHGGVDMVGILRAALKDLAAGQIVQGGSTITQQVVKSLLLTPERTFSRKIKEAILAHRIDSSLSKNEILYIYLNQIYLGSGAYGVEAAARTYFDEHASELDLAQAALLAGLPRAPNRFSPATHLEEARKRQRYVLQRMVDANFITSDQAQKALAEPLHIVDKPTRFAPVAMNYFTEEVRREAEARFGREMLYKEGLTIDTTLDYKAQLMAQSALEHGLSVIDRRHRKYRGLHVYVPAGDWPNTLKILTQSNGKLEKGKVVAGLITAFNPRSGTIAADLGTGKALVPESGWKWVRLTTSRAESIFRPGDVLRLRLDEMNGDAWVANVEQDPGMEGAIMSMSPDTGRVICMVGGRNFKTSQFNRCTQAARQPGSSFKPIIYAAALDKGYTEASVLMDTPITFLDHTAKGSWTPENFDRRFKGPILLRNALIHSRNVPTVKLLKSIGLNYAINYARQLGIKTPLTHSLSLGLGASEVTLQELLSAYSTFPGLGQRVQPYLMEKVYDRFGNLIEQHQTKREQVISAKTAYLITDILEGVVRQGTGMAARALNRPCAGKTGTTNDFNDAWFIGYTPSVLTGVWVGYDDHSSLGKGEEGAHAACPIWVDYMKQYLKDKPVETFTVPEGIVFAKVGGSVAGSDDSGGVYAAFADKPPGPGGNVSRQNQQEQQDEQSTEVTGAGQTESAPPPVSQDQSPAGDSYFKSELY
ncbi:MAG: PBP1A family penicillin-binding protein [Syntrophobacteraceae bacterium]|nr:PBP1A family penicillin-binding protein [Syntrophobacteraceae bacterium]